MRRLEIGGVKYIAIGFACLVVAMAILRTLRFDAMAPAVAGAILFSVLVACANQARRPQTPEG